MTEWLHSYAMEPIGTLVEGLSKHFNTLFIYSSIRKPGFVYEWSLLKGKKFQCCGCKRLRKMRCIALRMGRLFLLKKHPEDDHHDQCQPVSEAGQYITMLLHTAKYDLCFSLMSSTNM